MNLVVSGTMRAGFPLALHLHRHERESVWLRRLYIHDRILAAVPALGSVGSLVEQNSTEKATAGSPAPEWIAPANKGPLLSE